MEQLNVSVVSLSGSAFDIGFKQGVEIKTTQLVKQLDFLKKYTKNTDPVIAKERLITFAPHFLEELTGIAIGLNVQLDTIIKLYSGFDVDFPSMGCTTFIQEDYYVRNYDFSPEIYDARFVFSNPNEGYASMGFSQQVLGRLDGMNEKGLVIGLHFVNDEHKGEGFLATTIVRLVLEQCCNVTEAVSFLTTIPHRYCYNYSITDVSGEAVVVEASPNQQIVHYKKPLSCTNHFEANSLQEKNKNEIQESKKRKAYINRYLTREQSPLAAYHHFNNGDSPLFFKNYNEYFGTLHTIVYLPQELSVMIGIGENCEPIKLSLKEFVDGLRIPLRFIKGKIKRSIG